VESLTAYLPGTAWSGFGSDRCGLVSATFLVISAASRLPDLVLSCSGPGPWLRSGVPVSGETLTAEGFRLSGAQRVHGTGLSEAYWADGRFKEAAATMRPLKPDYSGRQRALPPLNCPWVPGAGAKGAPAGQLAGFSAPLTFPLNQGDRQRLPGMSSSTRYAGGISPSPAVLIDTLRALSDYLPRISMRLAWSDCWLLVARRPL